MSLRDVKLKTEYRSLLDNVINDFYTPVLMQSVLYKELLVFLFIGTCRLGFGIAGLIKNGGKIQLIASPRLSEEDVTAINEGLRRRDEVIEGALLRELNSNVGKFEQARLNLLSNLIAAGRLEIKIAFLESENIIGMFHEKVGLMYDDENNIVAFTGSMNESSNAFFVNYESIDVYTSWTQDEDRVLNKQSAFNAMWNDYEPSIHVISFPNLDSKIIEKYRSTESVESALVQMQKNHSRKGNNEKTIGKRTEIGPAVPTYVSLREYQKAAISAWEKNNYRGIFDMATGERVIIVMGAVNVMKPRVSGTLNKYILCIA